MEDSKIIKKLKGLNYSYRIELTNYNRKIDALAHCPNYPNYTDLQLKELEGLRNRKQMLRELKSVIEFVLGLNKSPLGCKNRKKCTKRCSFNNICERHIKCKEIIDD